MGGRGKEGRRGREGGRVRVVHSSVACSLFLLLVEVVGFHAESGMGFIVSVRKLCLGNRFVCFYVMTGSRITQNVVCNKEQGLDQDRLTRIQKRFYF